MERAAIGDAVRRVIASLSKTPVAGIGDGSTLDELGVGSLDVLLLRETLERRFGIIVDDSDIPSMLDVASIVQKVSEKLIAMDATDASPAVVSGPKPASFGGSWLEGGGTLRTDLEIGMPHTGINNLSEGALLREVGHLRWQHMMALTGLQSRDVVDEQGARLYPTFFYAEVVFPPARPMAAFRENDAFTIVSSLRSYGRVLLDGEHYLFPREWPDGDKRVPVEPGPEAERKVPYVRLSNSFVQKWQGTEWLKRSRPAAPEFERIPEIAEPPDSYRELARVKAGEAPLFPVPAGAVPLTPAPVTVPYPIVPDRDVNGAGLLYFANYPTFLDIAERAVLGSLDVPGFTPDVVNRRTLVHRKSAYLGNAGVDDVLEIAVRPYLSNPLLVDRATADAEPVRLHVEYRMNRRSDGRLIMVSSATKVIFGALLGDTPLLEWLAGKTAASAG